MGVQGWQLTISTGTYHTPNVCSSCLAPRETQLEAMASEKQGNVRRTLKMAFPYCNACAQRAGREKRREIIVIIVGAAVGLVLSATAAAGGAGDVLDPIVACVVAVLLSAGIAAAIAFATRPPMPPSPATARGEAVILRDTSGVVLCTNQRFAELLGQANSATPAPGRTIMSAETWAPAAAVLVGLLAVCIWAKYIPHAFESRPSPPPARVSAPAAPRPAPRPSKR